MQTEAGSMVLMSWESRSMSHFDIKMPHGMVGKNIELENSQATIEKVYITLLSLQRHRGDWDTMYDSVLQITPHLSIAAY